MSTLFKVLIIGSLFSLGWGVGHAEPLDIPRMVEAIGKAENSVKYPYGIKSINTHGDIAYARKICTNTVRNNYKRWTKAGKPGDFISFLGARFCPIGAEDDKATNLNRHWVGNVSRLYERSLKSETR